MTNSLNIKLLEAHLVPQGYEIVQAASGEEALKKLSNNQYRSGPAGCNDARDVRLRSTGEIAGG